MIQEYKEILKNILYAVETGGQIYGNKRYDDFTEAGTNTDNEKAITIGAGQWYGLEAKTLLQKVLEADFWQFYALDVANIVDDIKNADWSKYSVKKDSDKAKCIIKIISSDVGMRCQDQLMYEQIDTYEKKIKELEVEDIKAIMMCINIRHLGGLNAVKRILNKTKKPYTIDKIYNSLKEDQNDYSSNNQVGDELFWTRHQKVYKWINDKVIEGDNMGNYVQTVIDIANSYEGYIEKASRENLENKTANKGINNYTKFSEEVNALGLMGCQAQPWCCTYQFAIEVEAYGLTQALKNWNMTKDTYVGYNCFATYNAFGKVGKVSKTPKLGCLVIFTFSHVGRVTKINGDTITVNEGNTSAKTYDRNGGQVAIKTYKITDPKIKGFCIIDYETTNEPWIATGTAVCTGDDVKLRKTPNGTKIGALNKGNRFEVDGVKNGKWVHAKVAGLGIGYIYEDYVEYDKVASSPSTIIEVATTPFKDVLKTDYFHDAVKWAVENTFVAGVTDDSFNPNEACTRADALTFLWRVKGRPESRNICNEFTDVKETDYFYKAVLWAEENNITAGKDEFLFDPYAPVTRADFITFLWRLNGSSKGASNDYNYFDDVPANSYFYDAVLWAYKTDITEGLTKTHFGSNEPCTRGQVITFLYRSK